ncbi:MAG: peptidase signal peptidase [Acidimicrobiales bacterium]|nr:peptidase signal peptidase [Acidimicrobiales bacterium]
MGKRWLRGLAGMLLLVFLYAAASLWPAALGGATTYVSTHGSSMEPAFHQGDLALVRGANHYEVGDIVAYHSPTLKNTTVLHRIVGRTATGYTIKGDNNSFVDPDTPAESQLIGKLWVHVPRGGRLLGAVRLVVPLLIAGLGLLGGGAAAVRRQRRSRPPHLAVKPTPSSARNWFGATAILAGTAAACLLLGLVSFSRPTSQSGSELVRYTQKGSFTYDASAPVGPVYTDGKVRTGDPVFRRLVDRLDVTFNYALAAAAPKTLAGTIAVRTEVRSGNGWHRVLDTLPATAFSGDQTSTTIHLDLNRMEALVKEVEDLTGVKGMGTTEVSIRPEAKVFGTVGSQRVEETFSPTLDLELAPLQLRLTDPTKQLSTAKAGTLQHTTNVPSTIEAFGVAAPVGTLRVASLGLGLPALIGAGAGLVALRRRLRDEADRIELRHGHRMVPVSAAATKNVIEVNSMQDLARLAEQYGALILHRQGQRGHDYLLQADGIVYRYRTQSRVLA